LSGQQKKQKRNAGSTQIQIEVFLLSILPFLGGFLEKLQLRSVQMCRSDLKSGFAEANKYQGRGIA
jgi:hypothetical protein